MHSWCGYWAAGLQLLDRIRIGDEDCNFDDHNSDRELSDSCRKSPRGLSAQNIHPLLSGPVSGVAAPRCLVTRLRSSRKSRAQTVAGEERRSGHETTIDLHTATLSDQCCFQRIRQLYSHAHA